MGLMDFFKNIFSGNRGSNTINLYVKDKKCGEKIKILLRKSYDIQKVYSDEEEAAYEINKVVICNNCYNKINIGVKFDKRYNKILEEIDNGSFITEEEYNSSVS